MAHVIKISGISEELLRLVDERWKSQHYADRSEYVRDLVRRDVLGHSSRGQSIADEPTPKVANDSSEKDGTWASEARALWKERPTFNAAEVAAYDQGLIGGERGYWGRYVSNLPSLQDSYGDEIILSFAEPKLRTWTVGHILLRIAQSLDGVALHDGDWEDIDGLRRMLSGPEGLRVLTAVPAHFCLDSGQAAFSMRAIRALVEKEARA